MEFLNVLFIIILIIIALRLFVRYVFPYLLMRYFRKKQEEILGKMQDNQKAGKKPGDVSIDYNPDQSTKTNLKDAGEYADFEDVDDDE